MLSVVFHVSKYVVMLRSKIGNAERWTETKARESAFT
jgi:hypothetical protein